MSPYKNAPTVGAVEAIDLRPNARISHLERKATAGQLYARSEGAGRKRVRIIPVTLEEARWLNSDVNRYGIFHAVPGRWLVADLGLGAREAQLRRIDKFPLPCTSLVDTGLSYQAYWRIECISFNSLRAIEAALGERIGADPQAFNTNRLLHTPGSLNWDGAANGEPVRLVREDISRIYTPEDFFAALCMGAA